MELGRSAWIRRERVERIANAERDRRAGRTALAIAALGEASEWPARAVLALALLPDDEGGHARRVLEDGLDLWAFESGLPLLGEIEELEELEELDLSVPQVEEAPPGPAFDEFQIELDRPIEAGELERAFAEAEAQVDEMHDVNRLAERVLFDEPHGIAGLVDDQLDPLEESARAAVSPAGRRPMDAAAVPRFASPRTERSGESGFGDSHERVPSRAAVLATLERWLQNLERGSAGRMR